MLAQQTKKRKQAMRPLKAKQFNGVDMPALSVAQHADEDFAKLFERYETVKCSSPVGGNEPVNGVTRDVLDIRLRPILTGQSKECRQVVVQTSLENIFLILRTKRHLQVIYALRKLETVLLANLTDMTCTAT